MQFKKLKPKAKQKDIHKPRKAKKKKEKKRKKQN